MKKTKEVSSEQNSGGMQVAATAEETNTVIPALSSDQRLAIREVQVKALSLQAQKLDIDSRFEKAALELNGIYQQLLKENVGYSLNADTLEFVAQQ